MRQLYPVVPFEPSRNCLINLSNGRKSFLININAEGRISAAYSALPAKRRVTPEPAVGPRTLFTSPLGGEVDARSASGEGARASRESVTPYPPSLRSGTLSLWERESANASPLSSPNFRCQCRA